MLPIAPRRPSPGRLETSPPSRFRASPPPTKLDLQLLPHNHDNLRINIHSTSAIMESQGFSRYSDPTNQTERTSRPRHHRKRLSALPTGVPGPNASPFLDPKCPSETHLGLEPTDFSDFDPNPIFNDQGGLETTKDKLTRLSSLANRKALSVDSPSFTPGTLAAPKSSAITSQAANAAPFTPRGLASGKLQLLSYTFASS